MNFIYNIISILIIIFILLTPCLADEIHDAARSGDLEKIKSLFLKDPEIIKKADNRNSTPLHFAANDGNVEIIKFLVANGAKLEVKDVDGDTPLHWAAAAGKKEAVQLLIKLGHDVNVKNLNKGTALNWAVARGHKEIVTILLDAGTKLNIEGDSGITMLHNAASIGHQQLAKNLVDLGVSIQSKTKAGANLLHSTAKGGLSDFAAMLIKKGVDLTERDCYSLTPLHRAAQSNQKTIVDLLISSGADINCKSNDGSTALHIAQNSEYNDIVDLLISKAAVNNKYNFTILKNSYLGQKKPGITPEIFAPGIVSTAEFNERDVTFTPNLKEFYFTTWSRRQRMTIKVMKQNNNIWTKPETASFSGNYNDAEAFITHDGMKLYFISQRPLKGNGEREPWEIWFTNREGDNWSETQRINSLFKAGFYPTITLDGTLYYTTAKNDLYRSKLINGKYEAIESLGDSVNTKAAEYNSFTALDESFIIFSSFGWEEHFGGGDLYISFRTGDNSWTRAKNMGEPINSTAHDYCPSVSPDGKFFFFTSNRNGTEDIYWVSAKIIDKLRP